MVQIHPGQLRRGSGSERSGAQPLQLHPGVRSQQAVDGSGRRPGAERQEEPSPAVHVGAQPFLQTAIQLFQIGGDDDARRIAQLIFQLCRRDR